MIMFSAENLERLIQFVLERQRIYERRQAGKPKPWTDDPILQQYRFSNMLRENDTVTKWIADNWRKPYYAYPDLWFALFVARLINEPETLAEIGFPVLWENKRKDFETVVRRRKAQGLRVWNPAYMIPACATKVPKVDLNLRVLDHLWANRDRLRPRYGDTLRSWHMLLGQI